MARAVDLSALKARADAPPRRAPSAPTDGASGGAVVDVSEATFQAEVLERSLQVPVVLDLWAEWCGPCKQLGPVLEKLAVEGGGSWVLAKIDVDANPQIAQALGVQGIPAVKAVYQGQLVAEFTGALPEPEVRKWIDALVEAAGGAAPPAGESEQPPPEDPRFTAIEDAVAREDYASAERDLQKLLAAEPGQPEATMMLGQVRMLGRIAQHTPDAIARADAAPADVTAQLAAADLEVATGNVAAGLRRLVEVVRRTAGDDRNQVRERLIELFTAVGEDDPEVAAARRALSAALF